MHDAGLVGRAPADLEPVSQWFRILCRASRIALSAAHAFALRLGFVSTHTVARPGATSAAAGGSVRSCVVLSTNVR